MIWSNENALTLAARQIFDPKDLIRTNVQHLLKNPSSRCMERQGTYDFPSYQVVDLPDILKHFKCPVFNYYIPEHLINDQSTLFDFFASSNSPFMQFVTKKSLFQNKLETYDYLISNNGDRTPQNFWLRTVHFTLDISVQPKKPILVHYPCRIQFCKNIEVNMYLNPLEYFDYYQALTHLNLNQVKLIQTVHSTDKIDTIFKEYSTSGDESILRQKLSTHNIYLKSRAPKPLFNLCAQKLGISNSDLGERTRILHRMCF